MSIWIVSVAIIHILEYISSKMADKDNTNLIITQIFAVLTEKLYILTTTAA